MEIIMSASHSTDDYPIRRRKALTISEILEELEKTNDDEINTVAAIPPEKFDGLTDEEDIDDEELAIEEELNKDMAGTFEFETERDRQGLTDFDDSAPSVSQRRSDRTSDTRNEPPQKLLKLSSASAANWKNVAKESVLPFGLMNRPEELEELRNNIKNQLKYKYISVIDDAVIMSASHSTDDYPIRRRKALTISEILEELEKTNDDEINTVAAIPPEKFDGLTDEEDIDDEELAIEEELNKDMAGTFEFETERDRQGLTDFDDSAPSVSQRRSDRTSDTRNEPPQKILKLSSASAANWKNVAKESVLPFGLMNRPEELEELRNNIKNQLKYKSPSDIFGLLFDSQVLDLIVRETKRYAMQHNDVQFAEMFDVALLKRFIGILILSGYNKLPQMNCYWSQNPTLGSPIVQQTMPCSVFRKIKQYLHFQDNDNLDRTDKYTKIRNLYNLLNTKFMQFGFGVFEEHLSVDEQMLPYFGRHSCKMYMRNRPIKFGYKTWCMAGANGYVFRIQPYGGACDHYDKSLGLGASVVKDMVNQLEFPERHQLYFDNFFTSHFLMCLLREKRICATGTVRNNRLGKPSPDLKSGKSLPKGEFDAKYDRANNFICCRWQDKKEVTLLSNFNGVSPLITTKRRQRGDNNQPTQIIVQQPNMICNNSFMGGVDLHDNAVANYRIGIRSKKWWWPLWLGILETAIVNVWKLDCLVKKGLNQPRVPQLTFRVDLATSLLLTPDIKEHSSIEESEEDTACSKTSNFARVSGQHHLVSQPEGKARRCKVCHKPTIKMCRKCQVKCICT